MPAAITKGDNLKQDAPHCHAPIHPAAPTPTPAPHPAMPLAIQGPCAPTVKSEGSNQSVMMDMSAICSLASCVPNGPGMVMKVSMTVIAGIFGCARVNDMTVHTGCVAPIPSPVGKCMSPGKTSVIIGG
jgi:hypothetical protein